MDLPDIPLERTRRTRERAEELGRAADRATDPEHRQRLRRRPGASSARSWRAGRKLRGLARPGRPARAQAGS